jgi:hypothetical protein
MRTLPYNLEQALEDNRRRPEYRILAFNPKLDSMSAVVCGTYAQTPFDLTPYCSSLSWAPGRFSFVLEDGDSIFHPDFGAQRAFLGDGAIIRLQEGDAAQEPSTWVNTFTGMIQGQIGWRKSRRSQSLEAKITVYSRENNQSWKRRSITTRPYSSGTEIGVMLQDICTRFMGLSNGEIRIPLVLGLQLRHLTNQLAQVSPWDAVESILEAVGMVPGFDGDGRLTCYSKAMTQPVARLMADWTKILDYEVPEYNQEAINKIRVVFLDSTLQEIEGQYQMLGTAQATAGFFISFIKLDCWWGDDHKQRAKNTHFIVKQSVVTKVGRLASAGNFGMAWATETYQQVDDFHGRVTITVPWWTPVMFSASLVQYLVASYIGDVSLPMGGMTIPVGKVMQSLTLIQILAMMMCIGTGQYEIWGTPYDYAYLEKQSVAVECNLEYWQINERVIKNDFLGSQEQADAISLLELIWEKSKCFPRKLVIQDDPALEIGDMIRLPDGLKFFITGMSKSIKRGEVPVLQLDGFKVRRA